MYALSIIRPYYPQPLRPRRSLEIHSLTQATRQRYPEGGSKRFSTMSWHVEVEPGSQLHPEVA